METAIKTPLQEQLQQGAAAAEAEAAAAAKAAENAEGGGDGDEAAAEAARLAAAAEEAPKIPDGYVKSEEYEPFKKDIELINSDPLLKELFEHRKNGKAITAQLLEEGFKDYSKIDVSNIDIAVNTAVQALIEDGYTERAAQAFIKKKYPELFDKAVDTDSDEYDLATVEVKQIAKKYLDKKKETQVNLRNIQAAPTSKEEAIREFQAAEKQKLDAFTSQHKDTMKAAAEDLLGKNEKVGFELPFNSQHTGEVNLKVEVEITKEMKAQLKKDMQDPTIAMPIYKTVGESKIPKESQEAEIMRLFMFNRYPQKVRQLEAAQAVELAVKALLEGKIKNHSTPTAPGGGEAQSLKPDPRSPLGKAILAAQGA